ncbi:TonB-dependent receptor plug domain-containing protein [Alloalcanivorax marinus]|uniref:TonB-dependent receptor plug domain-containing protein n=1 Tax=Alloalcanivorax marinus TaxID=1177169 RepID=UPI0021CE03F3|nr:TonB-dependent receptor [Alloalcanivorax marinus]
MRRIGGCALLALGMSAAPAWGQFDDTPGPVPRVLTPARLDQPISEVPASVTVIDRELILASGARELYEVMRLVPGMSVAKTDGNLPSVAYHGTQARDQRRMLVLLDGRSVYQPGFARVNWNAIPVALEDVERIEVTRGPASAAYGANAFTGVINIITRDPRDVEGQQARLRAGNNRIRDARVAASHQFDGGAWRLSVNDLRDDGYDADIPPLDTGDRKHVTSVNGRAVWEPGPRDTLTLHAGGSRTRLDRPYESGLQELGEYTDESVERADRLFVGLDWQRQFSSRHQLKVSFYAQHNDEDTNLDLCYFDPLTGNTGPGGGLFYSKELRDHFLANGGDIGQTLSTAAADPAVQNRYAVLLANGGEPFCGTAWLDVSETRYDLEIQDTLQFSEWARLVAGVNVRHDRGESQAFVSGTAENVSRRLFANLALRPLPPVTVNLGGFWEYDDISGEHFSPRAGVNWEVLPGHTLRAVYARALRTPDIYEDQANINLAIHDLPPGYADREALLGWAPAYFFANQQSPGTLEPERIRSRELGYYGRFTAGVLGTVELDVRHFQEELWDLVSGPLNPFDFEPDNEGEVRHRGTEAQLSWRPAARHLLRLTGAHIHTETNSDSEQRFAARDSAGALWYWRLGGGWWWSTAYHLARDYNDYPFERIDAQLGRRQRLAGTELEWRLLLQHPLNDEPVVFEENRYQDDPRYWLTVTVNF